MRTSWAKAAVLAGAVWAWGGESPGAEGARLAFDRPGGFTVAAGEAVRIAARVEGGGGYGISRWEGNAPGRAEGRGNGTWVAEGAEPGMYWLRAVGWCDGTDEEVRGTIRFRVAEAGGAAPRERLDGEATVWSEDFSGLASGSGTVVNYNGWTGEQCYNASNSVRVGSAKAGGYVASPEGALRGSPGRLEFSLRKHDNAAAASLQRSVDGGTEWVDWVSYASSALASTARVFSVEVPACETVRFRWANSAKNQRFYLDDVALYATGGAGEASPPWLEFDPQETEVELYPGLPYSLTATATEFDGDEITLEAAGLPEGSEWLPGTPGTGSVEGTFTWTPAATGTWAVAFSASDKDGTTEKTVTFNVVPEGPGKLGFATDAMRVNENAGTATLVIVRTGGAAGWIGVDWRVYGQGLETTGLIDGTVYFENGQTRAEVPVTVVDDLETTGDRTFTGSLISLHGTGAAWGDFRECTVTVVDDEDTGSSYYAGCYADGALKTGADLKDALCRILNTGVATNAYGSGLDTVLRVTDACPTNGDLVQCFYLQRGVQGFNKEHVWAQSHGIDRSGPAYSDLHHIRACTPAMNSARGDKDFDDRRDAAGAAEVGGCWYTDTAWEPPDSAKGDVARAVLYMDVRYENKYGGKADLELVDAIGTSREGNQLGKLGTLLAWNELDPPDDFERRRNELIHTTYQFNRNPFVDHPAWARAVFDPEHFAGETGPCTLRVTSEGQGLVDGRKMFAMEVTNGATAQFELQADAWWHVGSIAWNGTAVPPETFEAAAHCIYTCPAVTNSSMLEVSFVPDLAAMGTPVWWLVQYGYDGDWDAAELADLNADEVPNWQEYLNGTDPSRPALPRVTGVTATAASEDGFTVGWRTTDRAEQYRVRVCETGHVAAASAGFEGGKLDAGWEKSGKTALYNGLTNGWSLSFEQKGDWLACGEVENPAALSFQYWEYVGSRELAFAVQVSEDGGTSWTTVGCVTNLRPSRQLAEIDLSAWNDRTVRVRLIDVREGTYPWGYGYADDVTVWHFPPMDEETVAGSGTATWRAEGLARETGYLVFVRAEAAGFDPGPWSALLHAETTSGPPKREQTISFGAIADQVAGATVALLATASSGLPVAFAASGPASLSGNVLTCIGEGTVTVTASQSGDDVWAAAPSVAQTFRVAAMPPAQAYAAWVAGLGLNAATAAALAYDEEHAADFDGDGVPNWNEYVADTDPTDPGKFFYVTLDGMSDSGDMDSWDVGVRGWNVSPARDYTLLYFGELGMEPVEGDTNPGESDRWSKCVPRSRGFLAVRVELPQE